MLLYSIASGVCCAGIVLLIGVVGAMIVTKAFSGSLLRIFSPHNGDGWPMIFMALYSLLAITAGPTAFFLLGYQQVDWFVTILSCFLAYVFGWVGFGVLSGVTQSAYMRKMARYNH